MRPVWTAAAMRAADREVIEGVGLPGVALMELASAGLAQAILRHHAADAARGVVIVCGPGNNGGDGYGAARWLKRAGVPVAVLPMSPDSSCDAALMRQAAQRVGVPEVSTLGQAGLIVDALFGTGLSRDLDADALAMVRAIDAHPAVKVAADLPSGLDSDDGHLWGAAPTVARTVTFGGHKQGMFCGEGPRHCGVIDVVELALDAAAPPAWLTDADDIWARWPRRDVLAPKTRTGQLLVLAGSTRMAGAAVLSCRGALAGGAGMVTLATPRGALSRLGALPPEVMVIVSGEGDVWDGNLPPLQRYDAIVAGPGLGGGTTPTANQWPALALLWRRFERPMLFDADGLPFTDVVAAGPRVITPHAGEAARWLGTTAEAVERDRFAAARELAEHGAVALLKGRHTLIADAGSVVVNPTGAPSLATAGSGDVLSGLIGALLARGSAARDAAVIGAWVHGRAGESLDATRGASTTASDIADGIMDVVRGLAATG